MKKYDVIIVGGGIVGASLAYALKDLPLKIAMVEAFPSQQKLQKDFDARSIALSFGSYRIFETLNLWSSIAAHAEPIKEIHISDRGRFGATRFNAKEKNLSAFGYLVELQDLMNVLYDACRSASHIDWFCPARCEKVVLEQPNSTIYLDTPEGEVILSAALIVGADGTQSTLRKLVEIKTQEWSYPHSAIVANVGLKRSHEQKAFERFADEGAVALLPMQNQRAALIWNVKQELVHEWLALSDADFLKRLQTVFGYRLGRLTHVGKRSAFPLKMVKAQESVRTGLVLIGNASHTLHPIAGQGFNLGLRDVATLAEVIAEGLKNQELLGDLKLLNRYQSRRDSDQKKMIAFTDGLTRIFHQHWLPVALLRDLGLLGIDIFPPLKKTLMQHTMGMGGQLSYLTSGLPLTEI
ncbi:MAG: 2-octaprenyl-6-methoxyphenyl hydroxylase [Proteobacteria bacterium]|nr:2-octaprenyl-6-methoxyphenyl hydroxylase [Pseudomonadota bacterium]